MRVRRIGWGDYSFLRGLRSRTSLTSLLARRFARLVPAARTCPPGHFCQLLLQIPRRAKDITPAGAREIQQSMVNQTKEIVPGCLVGDAVTALVGSNQI